MHVVEKKEFKLPTSIKNIKEQMRVFNLKNIYLSAIRSHFLFKPVGDGTTRESEGGQ